MKICRNLALAAFAFTLMACSSSSDADKPTLTSVADSGEQTTTTAEVASTEAPAPNVPADSALPALGECPSSVFPDLSGSIGPGDEYVKPNVVVECTDTELVVTSNGMPSYTFEPLTPNALTEQAWVWRVPLKPTVATSTTSIVDVLGTLGFTTTGLPIYGPTEGPQPATEAFGDPIYNGILDTCGGHTGFAGDYHDHALYADVYCDLTSSFIIGYALDGFPIYNSVGCHDW